MMNDKAITPSVKYFFRRLEKRSEQIQQEMADKLLAKQTLEFEEVNNFFRQIMTQNIFINTVGQNGKRESTILSKAIFSMNRIVRVYYSTSFDDVNGGFVRIRPDKHQQMIIVERLHGHRPQAEFIYGSRDQCHIIRFMIRWLMRRIDWDKTKLSNLDLYKRFIQEEEAEAQAQIAAEMARIEREEIQRALEQSKKKKKKA